MASFLSKDNGFRLLKGHYIQIPHTPKKKKEKTIHIISAYILKLLIRIYLHYSWFFPQNSKFPRLEFWINLPNPENPELQD